MSAHELNELEQFPDTPGEGWVALLSDIHGNLLALEAVLEDLGTWPVQSVFCLGDIVGYGPDPGECVRRIRTLAEHTVMGNHEMMMLMLAWRTLSDLGPELTPSLRRALDQLSPEDLEWVSSLPIGVEMESFALIHSSFHQPAAFHYIQETHDAAECLRDQPKPVSFHGHTHVPVIWKQRGAGTICLFPSDKPVQLQPRERYTINVGSVGQPRDEDPTAAYCLFHPASLMVLHRRVAYDIPAAQARFRAACMREFDALRIAVGD